jgi:hypothetical protein
MRIGLWRGDRVVDVQEDVDDEDMQDLQAVEEVFDAEVFVPQEAAAEVNIEVDEEADEEEVDVEARAEVNAVDEEEVNEGAGGAVNAEEAEQAHRGDVPGEDRRGDEAPNVPVERYNLRERNREQIGRWVGQGARVRPNHRRVVMARPKRGAGTSVDDAQNAREWGLIMKIKQAVDKLGYAAIKSIVGEMMQHFDVGTFQGVKMEEMSAEQLRLVITSSMFLKEKKTAQGLFDKLKARLVAGGHLQDRDIYDDSSSPTVSTTSIFVLAAIAAHERRATATVDFPGAYLHSDMPEDKPVYMRLNKFETSVMVLIDPSFKQYVLPDGRSIVKLKKALYGCVESSRLWFEKIAGDLAELGFKANEYDPCVFNRGSLPEQTTVVVYVDDIFISALTESDIDNLLSELNAKYPNLSVKRGKVLDYLGMTFDFSTSGKCKVTMEGYIADLLNEVNDTIQGVSTTPASANLFSIDESSEKLCTSEKEFYHTFTAKLLYLGKRVRPDLLTAVSFLAKRVQAPTQQDFRKLQKSIKYLRQTAKLGIVLEASKSLCVLAYIDSSYAVHADMKSHTGVVIGIGRGPVYAKSSGQKLNTKSSTESELVGLSDSTNQVIWVRNMIMAQGYDIEAAKVYQDNQSTIAMVKNGKSNSSRTRHIAVRFYFVADRVKSGEVAIEYLPTGEMIADILTKPLQGALFLKLRGQLLNME